MPMFDDPREELRRLQAELLAAEEEEEYVDEDLEGLDDLLDDYEEEEDYGEDIEEYFEEDYEEEYTQPRYHRRNYGVDYADDLLELEEDDTAVYRDEYRAMQKKRKKGVRRLLVIACLELIGILAILGWWLQ